MLGFVPGAVGRCCSSRCLQLLKSNSVLRQPETPSPHEINIYITSHPYVSPRSVSLCLLVLQIRSPRLGHHLSMELISLYRVLLSPHWVLYRLGALQDAATPSLPSFEFA